MQPVLVVEDDADTVELLRTVLSGAGFDVTAYDDADEALRAIPSIRPCLVVLDLRLRRGTGRALLDAAERGVLPPVAIVVTTGDRRPDVPPEVEVLHKPYDPQDVVDLARRFGHA